MSSSGFEARDQRARLSALFHDPDQPILVPLRSHEKAALDLWIAMHPQAGLTREDAIRQILTKAILRQG